MTATVQTLAPGSVPRPPTITPGDWARMPWPARLKVARRAAAAPAVQVDDESAPRGPYRGGPVATQPCGTYAAYQRHKRRGEKACRACLDANNARWTERRIRLGLRIKRTAFDPDLVARFVRDEVPWDELSVDERIEAARRLDGSRSRAEIARRTHLNPANLRRAFDPASGDPSSAERAIAS